MCLWISKFHHLFNKDAKTALFDKHVYKRLVPSDKNNIYYTPVQWHKVKSLLDTIKMSSILDLPINRYGDMAVERGIHAYRNKHSAEHLRNVRSKIYNAIIPKGSKYYVGECGEIVSNQLIVFTTKEAYKNYKKHN